MAIELDSFVWSDSGVRPVQGDEVYSGGEQPIAEYDNWFNYSISRDVHALADEVNDILDRLPDEFGNYIEADDPVIEGPLDLNGYDMVDGARTIWNASNQYIQQSALQNEAIEIETGEYLTGGGQVRLGRSIELDAQNLVDKGGDTMSGDLLMGSNIVTAGNFYAGFTHHRGTANFRNDAEIYTYTGIDDYNLVLSAQSNEADGTHRSGLAFVSSGDSSDMTPGASVTYQRTGEWGQGQLTFQTKGEPTQNGDTTRNFTIQDNGYVDMYNNQLTRFIIEHRDNRPAGAPEGRMIYRTDK